ncbi:MAG: CinA family protein [Kineosporiaceae bacterium]
MSAHDLVRTLADRGWTLAVAESLTGGLVTAAVVTVPGASAVLRGGVVAYATQLKADVLGVDRGLLERCGPVDEEVARQMADGVRRVLGADVGLATTGVAGPGPSDGVPAGTVKIACAIPGAPVVARGLHLPGDRDQVRLACVDAVLALAAASLADLGAS